MPYAVKPKTLTPWHRWCLIVTIVSPDRKTAEKRLGLTRHKLSVLNNQTMAFMEVGTIMHAALKMGLLKVDYGELGDWFTQRNVKVAPGIELDLEGDSWDS